MAGRHGRDAEHLRVDQGPGGRPPVRGHRHGPGPAAGRPGGRFLAAAPQTHAPGLEDQPPAAGGHPRPGRTRAATRSWARSDTPTSGTPPTTPSRSSTTRTSSRASIRSSAWTTASSSAGATWGSSRATTSRGATRRWSARPRACRPSPATWRGSERISLKNMPDHEARGLWVVRRRHVSFDQAAEQLAAVALRLRPTRPPPAHRPEERGRTVQRPLRLVEPGPVLRPGPRHGPGTHGARLAVGGTPTVIADCGLAGWHGHALSLRDHEP